MKKKLQKYFLITIVILFANQLLTFKIYSQSIDTSEYISKCNKLYSDGKFFECVLQYDTLIIKLPNFSIAYNNRGLARYFNGDHEGAKSDWKKAISLGSEDSKLLLFRFFDEKKEETNDFFNKNPLQEWQVKIINKGGLEKPNKIFFEKEYVLIKGFKSKVILIAWDGTGFSPIGFNGKPENWKPYTKGEITNILLETSSKANDNAIKAILDEILYISEKKVNKALKKANSDKKISDFINIISLKNYIEKLQLLVKINQDESYTSTTSGYYNGIKFYEKAEYGKYICYALYKVPISVYDNILTDFYEKMKMWSIENNDKNTENAIDLIITKWKEKIK